MHTELYVFNMKNCLAALAYYAKRKKLLIQVRWVWEIQKMEKLNGVCEGSALSQENQTLFLLPATFKST